MKVSELIQRLQALDRPDADVAIGGCTSDSDFDVETVTVVDAQTRSRLTGRVYHAYYVRLGV